MPHIRKVRQQTLSDFLLFVYTLDIGTRTLCPKHNGSLSTVVPTAVSDPWTFPRAKNCSTVRNFYTSVRTGVALSSPVPRRKTAIADAIAVFLLLVYTLDILPTKTSATNDAHPPTPFRVRSDAHGLSHALENMPPAYFPPSLCSGRAFKSCPLIKKVQQQKLLDFFGRGTRT